RRLPFVRNGCESVQLSLFCLIVPQLPSLLLRFRAIVEISLVSISFSHRSLSRCRHRLWVLNPRSLPCDKGDGLVLLNPIESLIERPGRFEALFVSPLGSEPSSRVKSRS
ncbi:hypothetical protein V6N12_000035, partial [Hibiscus sabdariffa]